jgi:hypothetical protein
LAGKKKLFVAVASSSAIFDGALKKENEPGEVAASFEILDGAFDGQVSPSIET